MYNWWLFGVFISRLRLREDRRDTGGVITRRARPCRQPALEVDALAAQGGGLLLGAAQLGELERSQRVAQSVGQLGISILSGAISTGSVAAFMSQCSMIPFQRVGAFMVVSIVMSTFFALVAFPTVLAMCGPNGDEGALHCQALLRPPFWQP